jgi:hypothetical protein
MNAGQFGYVSSNPTRFVMRETVHDVAPHVVFWIRFEVHVGKDFPGGVLDRNHRRTRAAGSGGLGAR